MPSGPRIEILTIFPELVESFLEGSLLGAARRSGVVDVRVSDLRTHATDRHRTVDDAPFGGGDGMVMKCEPVVRAVEAVARPGARVIALSPRGRRLDQPIVESLADERQIVLLCGRYAGFDERILEATGAEELSIGDYVISGGEAAALVVTEAVTRLIPGVLGNPVSFEQDSFRDGRLEHPVYTRPREFRGHTVPEVLLSGNHAAIQRHRHKESLRLTVKRRPDCVDAIKLSEEDRKILRELENERDSGA
ncbi:MAG: tRNA (guanosine(37)-N1)-methyltransferase TrmD [bacterium]|nr:tRNA (guanosine(37)-N1)-methyltransferase TrmD [bacterium]